METYITNRIAELEAHARQLQTELIAATTVVAELRTVLQQAQKNAPPPDPEAGQQGAAGDAGDATAPDTPDGSAAGPR